MAIDFCGYKWESGNRWGIYHPNNPTFWCDPSCIDVTDNILRLQSKRHTLKTPDCGDIEIGVGLVTSVDNFGYGEFEAEVMLPKGTGLFPAFWLWASDSWPPEIDIFEGWSGKSGFYTSKYIPYYSLATNAHYGKEPNHPTIRAKSHMVWNRFDQTWNKFKLIWNLFEISIYYNDKLIRQIIDESILEHYEGKVMQVVFNNGVGNPSEYTNDSVMLVKNFKYTPF
jgi:beta-glucanase (GH16 family)